jgi:hypothetical protein
MFTPDSGSRIRIFLSRRIKKARDPRSATKNLSIFNPKNCTKLSEYDPGCLSRTPDTNFFHLGIRGQKAQDLGSATLIFSFFHFCRPESGRKSSYIAESQSNPGSITQRWKTEYCTRCQRYLNLYVMGTGGSHL